MEGEPNNSFVRFMNSLFYVVDAPVTYVREKLVEPNQKKYPWYHQQFRRVPTIESCKQFDFGCIFEAQRQQMRDKLVDSFIVSTLRDRYEHCAWDNYDDRDELCAHLKQTYDEAAGIFYAKYSDQPATCKTDKLFMKQQYRMVWERRHGPAGSGMKSDDTSV
nr:NADH dehydrogenase [ubiquinone] 1 beta subcomplex subunit 10 [Megalopta genalis]